MKSSTFLLAISILITGCTSKSTETTSESDSTAEALGIVDTVAVGDDSYADAAPGSKGIHSSRLTIKHHYTGVIGGKYKFMMNLYFNVDTVTGEYRYYSQKEFLDLKGRYDEQSGKFALLESYYDYDKRAEIVTGSFDGTRTGNKVTGTWYNNDRTKSYEFELSTDEKSWAGITLMDNSYEEDTWLMADTLVVAHDDGRRDVLSDFYAQIYKDAPLINLEDMNFDGYFDINVTEQTAAANTSFFCWLYEPGNSSFVRSTELEGITGPQVDLQRQRIISPWSDGCCHHGIDQHVYQDGHFYLIEQRETYHDDRGWLVTKYKVENGKSVKL